jgi:hypothetical protein
MRRMKIIWRQPKFLRIWLPRGFFSFFFFAKKICYSKIPLSQRITYFSQALICIRSAAETKSNIELKQEIQDKLDVAQIQQKAK